ncbi:MAG: DUF1570 domain-containing protein [Planctomycetaceae bacterium]
MVDLQNPARFANVARRRRIVVFFWVCVLLNTTEQISGQLKDSVQRPSAVFGDERSGQSGTLSVTIRESESEIVVSGRILVRAADGGLLIEERSGRIRIVKAETIIQESVSDSPFTRFNSDELSAYLRGITGPEFGITKTPHYVICSNSSPEYAEFCGKLLERVHGEFFDLFEHETRPFIVQPTAPLPIIILATNQELVAFGKTQHPDVSFEDTPGYYSVRENQVLMHDLSGEPQRSSISSIRKKLSGMPRQVSTVVHEAVHQLAFNSGLQVRMADNPLWFSEGLSLWFEPASVRSTLLWNRPGQVNPVHQPLFRSQIIGERLVLPLQQLVASDAPFQNADQVAAAYSESWALMTWLIRKDPEGMDRFMKAISQRKPLKQLTPDERSLEFQSAFEESLDEIETSLIPYIGRMRVP